MLARALTSILPDLSFDESLEVTSIHSIAGLLDKTIITRPPLRSPHHTASYVSVIGGGTYPKPGEVTLAHRGVLFMDEFAEFEKRVIETLRQPLEERLVSISRSKGSAQFPANFMLIAAMNPYPAGYEDGTRQYLPHEIERYRRKISGPIIDRIDMWVEVSKIDYDKLSSKAHGETSRDVRKRVEKARSIQGKRFGKTKALTNSEMRAQDIEKHISLDPKTEDTLKASAEKLNLSARSYHRVIKLARTIADLEESNNIQEEHILEALQYRPKEM
jgi:magnesium chelatase family protein